MPMSIQEAGGKTYERHKEEKNYNVYFSFSELEINFYVTTIKFDI